MSLKLFESPWLNFLIQDSKQGFLNTKAVCLPITREILLKITRHQTNNSDKLNIDITLKVEMAGIIPIGKTILTTAQQVIQLFKNLKVTRANILFFKFDLFVTLRLITSKTDTNYTGVLIVIRRKPKLNYPITAICKLFFSDIKPVDATFINWTKEKFCRKYLIDILKS